ncbi:Crp/Fnr family transcriptional regulator [uncultured Acetobacteroides sp.]|uniref:Crp/Fnr family transcriptional regulator n=1 Tax=uncultured Acetobacteroides sp. TaxID=1760811 RepID=UPI0029F502D6|nr:Crp/Fnr family transcriptional regulator [uncultured Acetobacteroides sp.]
MNFTLLSRCPLFHGVDPVELETLLSMYPYAVKSYVKGNVLASRDDEYTGLMVVLEGSVKGEMVDNSGKVVKIEDISAPRPIAPAFLFGQNNRLPVDVVANDVVKVVVIPRASMVGIMQASSQVLTNYLDMMSNRATFLSNKLYFLSFRSIKEKLAHYLLDLAKGQLVTFSLPMGQQELADYFGVTRSSLARVFAEMERDGLVAFDRRRVTLLNRTGLVKVIR